MRAIGVSNPDENLLFRLTQIIALCEENYEFSQELVWQCMDDLQTYIKSAPRPNDLPYVEHYPATADALQSELQKHAYGKGPLPVSVDLPELASVLGSAKKRGRDNPKGKTAKMPKWMNAIPEQHRLAVMNAFKASASGSSKGTSPDLPITPDTSQSTSQQPAQQPTFTANTFRFQQPVKQEDKVQAKMEQNDDDEDEEEDDTEEEEGQDKPKPKDIHALEMTMLAARGKAKARAATNKKRPAAASDAAVLKKPAARAKAAVMHKPAACADADAAISKKPAVKTRVYGIKNATWKNVHSMIHHRVKLEVFNRTGDVAAAKQAASDACTRAKPKFLKRTLCV